MQALVKPCNLPQTRSKSNEKQDGRWTLCRSLTVHKGTGKHSSSKSPDINRSTVSLILYRYNVDESNRKVYIKRFVPSPAPFWHQRHNLNKLVSGLLDYATYQILRFYANWFQTFNIFLCSPYISPIGIIQTNLVEIY